MIWGQIWKDLIKVRKGRLNHMSNILGVKKNVCLSIQATRNETLTPSDFMVCEPEKRAASMIRSVVSIVGFGLGRW